MNKWVNINHKKKKGIFSIIIVIFLILIAFSTYVYYSQQKNDEEAKHIFNKGMIEYENGNLDNAISKLKIVHDDYKGTSVWGMATYNIGIAYMQLKEYKKAIPYFRDILKSNVNDFEPGECVMEAYRNYRHKSCMQISICYEKLENYEKALDYAILAREKYKYESWCGTCLESENQRLDYRIRNLTVYNNWYINSELKYEFKLNYDLKSKYNSQYFIYLPIPIAEDNSINFFIDKIKKIDANFNYNIVNTKYGSTLNFTCRGSCSFEISYQLTLKDNISDEKLISKFSLKNENNSGYYTYNRYSYFWIYYSYNDNYFENNLILNLDSYWIKYPPNWEYNKWKIHETPIKPGWNDYYLDESYIPKDLEGPEQRPSGGNCLEFDYERNNILIGSNEGFGIYNLKKDSYKIVSYEYNAVSAIAIDYKKDIYYFGTKGDGIKMYDIKNNSLIENPPNIPYNNYIRRLAYDGNKEALLIFGYDLLSDVPYYNNDKDILFFYNEGKLFIRDYKNNITNYLEITDDTIDYHIININFAFDSDLNMVFLSFEYSDRFNYNNFVNWTVLGYNLKTHNKIYINLSENQSLQGTVDLTINSKQHKLYIATYRNLYLYDINKDEINRLIETDIIFDGCYFNSLTYDSNSDVLYFSNKGTLGKYFPNNGTMVLVK